MTEKEKMLAGETYFAVDPQLLEELLAVKEIIHEYNLLRPSEKPKGKEILKRLLGHIADDILPGVKIGDNVTIGAGSVVTKDIPSNCVAVGNPCIVVKSI